MDFLRVYALPATFRMMRYIAIILLVTFSYLEAMACGLPLLCKRDACLKGILKNEYNGIVFRNMCEFAEGAERLLNDAELNEGMRKHSLKISERFSAENNAKLTLEVYKQVIQRRS